MLSISKDPYLNRKEYELAYAKFLLDFINERYSNRVHSQITIPLEYTHDSGEVRSEIADIHDFFLRGLDAKGLLKFKNGTFTDNTNSLCVIVEATIKPLVSYLEEITSKTIQTDEKIVIVYDHRIGFHKKDNMVDIASYQEGSQKSIKFITELCSRDMNAKDVKEHIGLSRTGEVSDYRKKINDKFIKENVVPFSLICFDDKSGLYSINPKVRIEFK